MKSIAAACGPLTSQSQGISPCACESFPDLSCPFALLASTIEPMTNPSKRQKRPSCCLPYAGETPAPSDRQRMGTAEKTPDPSHEEPGAKAAGAAREETMDPARAALQRFLVRLLVRMAGDSARASEELLRAASERKLL
jgi:hypothetical protein